MNLLVLTGCLVGGAAGLSVGLLSAVLDARRRGGVASVAE